MVHRYWFLLVLISLVLVVQGGYFLSGTLMRSAVQAPTGRRRREFREEGLDFDAAGNLPRIEEVYKDLNDYASPICAIRFMEPSGGGGNDEEGQERQGILLAYGKSLNISDSSAASKRLQTTSDRLQAYSGLRNCVSLGPAGPGANTSLKQSVLITGDIGDTRAVSRIILQISLNHTFDYDRAASGKYLAENLGSFVQQATMGADNPLKAHILIASTTPEHSISLHSVDVTGNVAEVMAGVAGRGMAKGVLQLEEQYRANITLHEAKELAASLINPPPTQLLSSGNSAAIEEGAEEEEEEEQEKGEEENVETVKYNVEFVVM